VLELTLFPALLPHSTALTISDVENDIGHQPNRWRRPSNPDSSEANVFGMCTDYKKRPAHSALCLASDTWKVADQTGWVEAPATTLPSVDAEYWGRRV